MMLRLPRTRSLKGAVFLFLLLAANGLGAETLSLDLGEGALSSRLLLLIALLSVFSLAPSLLVMLTSFTRIAVVMSFLRHGLGLGQSPPNSVLLSLSLFLTFFTMHDTLQRAYDQGLAPYLAGKASEEEALTKTVDPFRTFMLRHVGKKEMAVLMDMAKIEAVAKPAETPMRVLIPAFMLTELKRAFEIGFLVCVPFLIIDMVVASVVMAMGMMMLPPTMLSLPFKIIFFVLSDGWALLAGSLVRSYS